MKLSVYERIIYLMTNEFHLNENQFAQQINISQATINSLKRSKTGDVKSNLLVAIKKAYPAISLDWLLLGEGNVFIEPSKNFFNENRGIVSVDSNQGDNNVIIQNNNSNKENEHQEIVRQKDLEIAKLTGKIELLYELLAKK